MENEKPLTPEEKDSFKQEVLAVIDQVFSVEGEMTKAQLTEEVCKSVEALSGGEEKSPMGGLGAEAEGGMKLPEEETEE